MGEIKNTQGATSGEVRALASGEAPVGSSSFQDGDPSRTQWRAMETAPKDHPILAWCDHEGDPWLIEAADGRACLTLYAAHSEGMASAPTGFHIVEWGGGFDDRSFEYDGGHLPDWWFVSGSEYEIAANPVRWMPLPPAPGMEAEGRDAPAARGEARQPDGEAVAPQPPSSTPGEVERLVDALIDEAHGMGHFNGIGAPPAMRTRASARLEAARTALLSHISTAGRGEGAAPDWLVEFVRAAANTVAQTTLPGSALREVAERAFAWAVIEGQALSAADATTPTDGSA